MKKLISLLVLALTVGMVPQISKANAGIEAVIQINEKDPDKASMALKNIGNILKAAEKENSPIDIKVIVFGPALKLFLKNSEPSRDASELAKNKNINFLSCGNSMKAFNLRKIDLFSEFQLVNSGAFEVLKLQSLGYNYLRP